ncbi:OLC1v1033875C1 [Oldenlandia corymbosa var. corymbosa]|uniref:OLC1v1033875C1 n=1 Tax=Oldenlandia corymbosa var. corymbosa TaxID=529605 RepID=A0AAV1CQ12_OLDCO|nr:OLC1v1033875C1 [Oldenlandia corymbosa var. corymbosa]
MDAKGSNNSTTPEANSTIIATSEKRVQHVGKKSSDELLRKFAEVGSASDDKKELRLAKRMKRSSNVKAMKAGIFSQGRMYVDDGDQGSGLNGAIVERKCLLPPVPVPASSRKTSAVVVVRRLRVRDIKHKYIFGVIGKTWRRTVEGASRVFMEKHYNRHKRLANEMF